MATPRGGRTDGADRRLADWPRLGRAVVVRSAGVVASPWPARGASVTDGRTPVLRQDARQSEFIHDDDVIETLASDGSDEPLRIPVLPR